MPIDANDIFDGAAAGGASLETLPAQGEGRIILCDVNGTLIDSRFEGGFNRSLFLFLLEAEKRGYEVQFHSGSAYDNMKLAIPGALMRNRVLMPLMKDFIARHSIDGEEDTYVREKGDIPTKTAFLTIDDEHHGGFNSQAPNQWPPKDPRIAATMAAWGGQQTPTAAPAARTVTAASKPSRP